MTTPQQAMQILKQCENEMRYAGWATHADDNPQRKELYTDVVNMIAHPVQPAEPVAWRVMDYAPRPPRLFNNLADARALINSENGIARAHALYEYAALTLPVQPAPRKPITADDVTDEVMGHFYNDIVSKDVVAYIINTWIKHRGDTK